MWHQVRRHTGAVVAHRHFQRQRYPVARQAGAELDAGAIAGGPAVEAGASALSASFDTTLVNGAGPIPSLSALGTADGLNLSVLNTYSLVDSIVANPGTYSFTDVTDPCLTGAVNYSGGTPCANPNQYLFWDALHPTAAADPIAMQSRPASESNRAVLPPRMLVCLDNVFAPWRRGNGACTAAALCRN